MKAIRIAVDAMGGDQAPTAPVRGALAARRAAGGSVEIVLLGDPETITKELKAEGVSSTSEESPEIIPAPEHILAEDPPVMAVRRKRQSPIVTGSRLLAEARVDALVSAGNTGALMVAGKLVIGTIKGIDRPGLAGMVPTWDGREFLMLDLGAQAECSAENLVQFALMGSVYLERVQGRRKPKVALLNIGAEAGKGPALVREAYQLLERSSLHFVGNVEGRELLSGPADVVVCEGFVGNVVLKAMEGTALGIFELLRREMQSDFLTSMGALLVRRRLRSLKRRIDYREFGGVPLLGLAGIVVKCHGASDATAMQNGILVAAEAVRSQMTQRIAQDVEAAGKAVDRL